MKSLPYYFLWNVTSTCIELMNRHWMILATWSKMWIFMKKSTSNAQFQNIFSFSGLFYSWLLEIQTLSFPSPGDLPPTRDWNRVSCTVGRCFTVWAAREVQLCHTNHVIYLHGIEIFKSVNKSLSNNESGSVLSVYDI